MSEGALYSNNSASAQIKSAAGKVYGISVNSHSSGTVRLNDGIGGTTSAGVKATGTLTVTDVFSDGETVTIEGHVYTMKTALTGVADEVLIGASAAASLDNLKSAINASAGEGSTYGTGTVANDYVTATTNSDTTQVVEAIRIGEYANAYTTTETGDNSSWGGATLASGAEQNLLMMNTYSAATGSQVISLPEPMVFNAGLYITVGGTIDYTVLYN